MGTESNGHVQKLHTWQFWRVVQIQCPLLLDVDMGGRGAVCSSKLVLGLRDRVDSILTRCFKQARSRHKLA